MAGTASPGRPGGARRASRSVRVSRRERKRLRAAAPHQYAGKRVRRPDDPAPAPAPAARTTGERPRGGRRALRPKERRTRGLSGTLGLTFVSAMVPGTGYLFAKRKLAGWVVLAGWALIFGFVVWYFSGGLDLATARERAVEIAFNPQLLRMLTVVAAVLLAVWLFVVWTSYRLIRPRERPRWHTVVGNLAVIVFCLIFAAPVVRGAQYAIATADLVDHVLDHNEVATTPKDRTAKDPWAGTDRVNVLLLGGDGGEGREGVRTDSMILLSIDTQTGKAVTFSLPRNMANAQFPEDSPLHDVYPYGFQDGDPADGEYMLNAVYRNVPAQHPGILGKSSNEGADAIKQAVEGTLGIPVEYYVLVNLEGFKEVVDALGGVTVNVNEPIAIGGDTSAGIPPDDYLAPGPDQHLNGFQALWFARGRWGSDDYERMERQRCMVDAIVEAADPGSLLLRYLDLLQAGQEIVYTDIPKELGSAFVELALRVKDAKVKSVVFRSSEEFSSADPDFDWMRDIVQRAIDPPAKKHHGAKSDPADDPEDACAYQPTGETVEDAEAADAAGY